MNLENLIEAVLFFKNEPIKVSALAKLIDRDENEVRNALDLLHSNLSERGIRLISADDKVVLSTAPEAGEILEKIQKEELDKDLGKAGLETLSIILYKGPISKKEIDYVRGVNSGYILRNLLVRGLIERSESKLARSHIYKPTVELLQYLGISDIKELPEYEDVIKKVDEFQKDNTEN